MMSAGVSSPGGYSQPTMMPPPDTATAAVSQNPYPTPEGKQNQQTLQGMPMGGGPEPGMTAAADKMPRANYDANAQKVSYAKRVRHGEEPEVARHAGVQNANHPVASAADPQKVNSNLAGDSPAFARAMGDQAHYCFNVDRSSFAHEAYRNGSLRAGSCHGSMFGGMGMNPMMGSMMMGGPMGSMYGMGSMFGMGMSRPASLFGSIYGMDGPMGSMYGMGVPMGSMYGMGGPMGSMYGIGGMMGSMYGMGAPMGGSMMGPIGGSMYGGMPGGGSLYGSLYGDQNGGGMNGGGNYGVGGGPQECDEANNVNNSGPTGVAAAPSSAPEEGQRRLDLKLGSATPQANPAAGSPSANAGAGGSQGSGLKNGVASMVVLSSATAANQPVELQGDPAVPLAPLEVLRTGPDAQVTAMAVKESPLCQPVFSSVNGGHNTAVLIATDGTPESRTASVEIVRQVLGEVVAVMERTAEANGKRGYYDARVTVCVLNNAKEAVDVVENSAVKTPEVGSHPVFGAAFMNMGTITVKQSAEHLPRVAGAVATACNTPYAPVIVVDAVLKQVRPSQKDDAPTDVLLSSVLLLISTVSAGPTAFFDALRSDAFVPPAITKSCVGGACRTVAVLCLPNCTDPSTAQAALTSLGNIRAVQNSAPRSGNLARFIAFATGENAKLREKPDVDPAVLKKVDTMLADGRAMLDDPRNVVPVAYPSSQRPQERSSHTPQLSSRDINAHAAEKGRDAANPVRVVVIASPNASNGLPHTFAIGADNKSIVDVATNTSASALEVVVRAPEDWRLSLTAAQVSEVQTLFQNGNNTAVLGNVSPNEVHQLDKQPLWLSYKRMVSSLLSVASQKYKSAEVSLSIALVSGNELLADLLTAMDATKTVPQMPQKLSVAYSPLFGPTVYKATIIKQPTPLQLESTINAALYHVPAIMEQHAGKRTVIVASAVMKGVTGSDVYTSSMLAASAMDPTLFLDILDKKPDVPHELFEYAFGGPCCTLFLVDVIQGDTDVAQLVELMRRLGSTQNRSVRICSVKKFIAFAEESLRKADAKAAAAKTEAERDSILRSKKSMEVFYNEYKTLIEDPEHHDPKTYRRSGGGLNTTGSGMIAPSASGSAATGQRTRSANALKSGPSGGSPRPSTVSGKVTPGKDRGREKEGSGRVSSGSHRRDKKDADATSSGSRRSGSSHRNNSGKSKDRASRKANDKQGSDEKRPSSSGKGADASSRSRSNASGSRRSGSGSGRSSSRHHHHHHSSSASKGTK